jgi:Kdo2-lipid IVA lauroyltransferase/acyltransferase
MQLLFRLLSFFPLWLLHALGIVIGWLSWLSPTYRKRFAENALQAGYSPAEVRQAVSEGGKLIAELPRLWMGRPVAVSWEGDHLIEEAHRAGKAIVFLTPHMGCFEITAQAYAKRYQNKQRQITVLFRPARKAWLAPLVDSVRNRAGLQAAPANLTGVKQLIKALQQGQAVGLLPDQVPPQGLGVWSPFFGKSAYTMTLSVRLARQANTTVLLAWGERLSWGRGYVVHLRRMSEVLSDDLPTATAQINRAMERVIREKPQQYLWGYARYKAPRVNRLDDPRTPTA